MQKKFISGKPYVIPARPEVLIRVIKLLQATEIDVDVVVAQLQKDVSLYSAVLATANTPLFSSGVKVTSLKQAVMRLGLSKMLTIFRIIALKTALSKAGRLERFWDAATEIAQLTVKISKMVSKESVEDAYSLGMMHNCGIPLMMEAIGEYRGFLINCDAKEIQPLLFREKELFGFHHFQVSTEIARRWLMPDNVIQAIRLQGSPIDAVGLQNSDNESSKLIFCSLLLAKDISASYRHYWRIENQQQSVSSLRPVLDFVGLSETDYLDIRESTLQEMEAK
ncbi:MAG: HDOD domain-containing protein [Pseudomonadales bacterium]|nr:HDOD domain-containing protein [Pseudomonadales bacterium]NRA17259.1 HDOD domain-containing protein [Oceanospirillaceae bacterium]